MANEQVITRTQKIIVNPATSSVSVINAGPVGPRGFTGPPDASTVLTVDGQIMTRIGGNLAPITRVNLAADAAFTAGLTAHVAAADPHPVYLTAAEGTTAINAGIAAHVALSDPHPIYLTAAEGNATYLTPAQGDTAYVNVGGDAMTGLLTITSGSLEMVRGIGDGSYVSFYNAASANRRGFLQGNSTGLVLSSESGVLTLASNGGINMTGGRVDFGGSGISGMSGTINAYNIDQTPVGNRIVATGALGYIFGNFINMTANVVAGWPAYVAGRDSGDTFMRWYNRAGTCIANRVEGTQSGSDYSTAAVSANPGGGNALVSLHCGGVAPVFFSQNGQGNNVWLRDSALNANSCSLRSAGFLTDSSRRWKKNINTWPLRNAGAAVEKATDVISRLHSVTYQAEYKDVEVPGERRRKAWNRLNKIRAEKGLDNYELPVHDCGKHNCSGTADDPCLRMIQYQEQRHGFIAEEVAEIIPNATRVDDHGIPSSLDYQQLTTVAIVAIQELIERVKVLEGAN